MNRDYLIDLNNKIMSCLSQYCRNCPKEKQCRDNCGEYDCDNYREIEREVIDQL